MQQCRVFSVRLGTAGSVGNQLSTLRVASKSKLRSLRPITAALALTLALVAPAQAQSWLTNGLLAYYPLNGNANDASGNGNNGQSFGPTATTNRFGNPNSADYFNGSSDYIWLGPGLRPANITACAWFNTTVTTDGGSGVRLILRDRAYGWNLAMITANGTWGHLVATLILSGASGPAQMSEVSDGQYNDGVWHFAALTYDGLSNSLYIDGTKCASGQYPTYSGIYYELGGGGGLAIGRDGDASDGYFSGSISDVQIYNRALSDSEMLDLYLSEARHALAYGNGGLLLASNYTFIGSVDLQLWSVFPNGNIFYTLDGSEPSFASSYYTGPFNLNRSASLRVIAYSADFLQAAEVPPIYLTVIPTYALNLTSPGGGTITASPPAGPYVSNSVVTLTPQSSNGWTFLEWRGDASGANSTVNLTMNRVKNVQAIFGTTLGTTVAGNGAVDVHPALPLYPYGTVARLTAIPQAGSYFAVWGNAGSGNTNPLYFTVTSAAPTVSSLFAGLGASQCALTVIPDGFGKVTISPGANAYTTGASVSLNAIPDPGQQFLAWSGDATGTQNPLPLSMNTNKTITGTFTRKPSLAVAPPLDGLFEDGFRFTLQGEFGQAYQIDASTNLVDWAPLTILTNAYGTVQFTDDWATNSALRFYRASAPTP